MSFFNDKIWGKGTSSREAAVRALLDEAKAQGATSDVLLYIEYGRGQKALEEIMRTGQAEKLGNLVSALETAIKPGM